MVEKQEVLKVAENARINITEKETENLIEEFEEILETFEKLEEVDTEDVEPAFHPVEVEPKTREDQEEKTLTKEETFQNTENEEGNNFKGPSV